VKVVKTLFALGAILLIISSANAQEYWERVDVALDFIHHNHLSTAVCAGDFNADGMMDIAAWNAYTIHWWENLGNNQYEEHFVADNTLRGSGINMKAADINSDGHLDLVYGQGGFVFWRPGGENGNFSENDYTITNAMWYVSGFEVVDLDDDNDMDVVVTASYNTHNVSVFVNDGNENFTRQIVDNFCHSAAGVCVADFDGDGGLDIVVTSSRWGSVLMYRDDGENNFTRTWVASGFTEPRGMSATDLDNDGDIDVVVGSAGGVFFLENDGNGTFEKHHIVQGSGQFLRCGDLDNDGDIDIINAYDNAGRYCINDGNQNFTAYRLTDAHIHGCLALDLADFNNDGAPDFLRFSGSYWDRHVHYYLNSFAAPAVGEIAADPASRDYGEVLLGTSEELALTISNEGEGDLTVSDITSDNNAFTTDFGGELTLGGGENLAVTVTFAPDQVQEYAGALTITSNDPDDGSINIDLTGVGFGIPDIEVSTSSLEFGEVFVGVSTDLTVGISNVGTYDLVVSGIAVNGEVFATDFAETITILAGASQDITVSFTPETYGSVNGNLFISSDDPDDPEVSVELSGMGLAADIELSDEAVDFGDVEFRRSDTMSFDISNDGNVDLIISGMDIDNEEFVVDFSDELTIEPGGSVNIGVVYNANTLGDVAGEIIITCNDPADPEVTVDLMGTSVWVSEFELLSRICDRAWQLRDEGVINRGQANSICVKPCHAERHLRRDRTRTAINNLNALINHIEDFVEEGVLSQEDGAWFVFETNFIIDLIQEFGVAGQGGQDLISELIPETVQIESVYPNPFNSSTNIRYGLPEEANISIEIFDISGRQVAELVSGVQPAGYHTVTWNANGFSVGLYLEKYTNSSNVLVSKVLLTK